MQSKGWKLVSAPVMLLGVAAPMLVNCGPQGLGQGNGENVVQEAMEAASGCPEYSSGKISRLSFRGDAKADGKVKAFLQAAYDIDRISVELESNLIASCSQLGRDLGMKEDELKAKPGGGAGADKVCNAVAARVKAALSASAEAKIHVEYDEPKCHMDAEGFGKCLDECGSPVEPGKLEASCSGGEVSVKCEGQCKGKCTVDAGAACTGTCRASCEGKCEAGFKGTCGGKCEGKCDGKNTSGQCSGVCEGKCDAKAEGTCSGTCEGTCSGTCELKAAASCSGSCSGGCQGNVKEPRCSGEYKPPMIDPRCQEACANRAAATAKCDPASVRVVASGKVNSDAQKLITALNKSLPTIIKLHAGTGAKLKIGAEAVGRGADGLISASSELGGKALACIKAGAESTARATASVKVSVKASVNVSASATGKASASGG
jgi:hypothetical protein